MSRRPGSRPMIDRRRVDLPAPLAPIRATASPARNSNRCRKAPENRRSGDKPMGGQKRRSYLDPHVDALDLGRRRSPRRVEPSTIFRRSSSTMSRSATARSACSTCSIQTTVTPGRGCAGQGRPARAFLLGQPACDFVQQQQLRVRRQRPGQFQPLAVQQRQRPGQRVGLVRQFAVAQHLRTMRIAPAPGRPPPNVGGDQQVFEGGHAGIGAAGSGRSARSRSGSADGGAPRVPAESLAAYRAIAADQVEQRRLAGAVRPQDAQHLARRTSKLTLVRGRVTAPKDFASPRAASRSPTGVGSFYVDSCI